ncbi:SLAP domain-containing protein [Companilactobacillus huachuanensis]|uniref:SLAP domain-containing protein n=1 Tax=Companilactobacillus huachuanensis TaxID=2559914 RepID=A0ABW1RJY3_9LACO|nr:SLAP domain-containing protein [Companilactobacillus huachuanensis]
MRFEQLKRKSNVILRKKLYKSGKNWIVATTLALTGGIILGASPLIVKADNVGTGDNVPQTENDQATGPVDTSTQDTATTSKTSSGTAGNGTDSIKDPVTPDNKKSATPVQPTNNLKSNQLYKTADKNNQSDAATPEIPEAPAVENSTTGLNDPSNLASSITNGKFAPGEDTISGKVYSGSDWYINQAGELHVESGSWAPLPQITNRTTTWNTAPNANKVKKIIFDGDVTAGSSIYGAFGGLSSLSEIDNLDKLDTSKTIDFGFLFFKDTGLTQFDIDSLDLSSAQMVDSMFSYSGLTSIDMHNFNVSTITDYTSMFNFTKDLKTADLSNMTIGYNPQNSTNMYGLFYFSGLESINVTGLHTPDPNGYEMGPWFEGCRNLKKLDLSSIRNMNGDTVRYILDFQGFEGDGVSGIQINTITLNNTTNYLQAHLTYDDNKYSGWVNDDQKVPIKVPIDGEKLASLYCVSDKPDAVLPGDANGNTTWTLVERPEVQSTIQYWTADQNQAKDKPIYTTPPFTSYIGGRTPIPNLAGYYTPEPDTFLVSKSGPINVVVQKIEPYNFKINVTYDDTHKTINPVIATIPVGTTDIKSATAFQNDLSQLPNENNDSLNLDSTMINLGALTTDGQGGPVSVTGLVVSNIIPDKDKKNLQAIINDVIQYFMTNKINPFSGLRTTTPKDLVDAHYGKSPAISNSNHSSGTSTGSTVDTVTTKDIDQTSATFSDRPKVQVYQTDGSVITDLFLQPDSSWYNDKSMDLNGVAYYRVATDEWVKANDVYIYVANSTYVRVYQDNIGKIVNAHDQTVTRELAPASDWYSDRYTEFNGQKYYRVATNEFVSANQVYEYTYSSSVITTKNSAKLYDEKGKMLPQTLPAKSSYKTDRFQFINGLSYYRVATDQFVRV